MAMSEPAAASSINFSQVNWKKDEHIRGFINHALECKDREHSHLYQQSEMNLAWYRGFQETFWSDKMGQMRPLPNPHRRVRLIYNQILPTVDAYIAKLAFDPIVYEVVPATADESDRDVARLSSQVLRYYQDIMKFEALVERLDRWSALTGHAFCKVCWDPTKSQDIEFGAEDFGMEEDEFEKEFGDEVRALSLGDIHVEEIPIFNIHWGPEGVAFEDAEWVLEVCERSKTWARERYDVKPEDLPDAHDGAEVTIWRPGRSTPHGADKHEPGEDSVLVKSLWVKRMRTLPKGKHITMLGDKIVRNIDNPYDHGEIPIVSYPHIIIPGDPCGMSVVNNMISPQADINRLMSQMVENRETMANPVWLARHGTIHDFDEWNTRPGGIRQYIGEKPHLEQGAAMPNVVMVQLDKNVRFLQDSIGIHDVSQAKVPAGIKSGRAIMALQDADDTRLAPVQRRRRQIFARIGRLMLQTLAQFVTEERLIKILGDENQWETARFTGQNLRGKSFGPGVDYWDVTVRATGAPRSRAAQMEMVFSLIERGFLRPDDQEGRSRVFEMLEMGDSHHRLDPTRRDRDQQRFENDQMAAGQQMPVRLWDDHEVHQAELNKFRKRPEFRELPEQVQQMFAQHEQQHQQAMVILTLQKQALVQNVVQQAGFAGPQNEPAPPDRGGMKLQEGNGVP